MVLTKYDSSGCKTMAPHGGGRCYATCLSRCGDISSLSDEQEIVSVLIKIVRQLMRKQFNITSIKCHGEQINTSPHQNINRGVEDNSVVQH